MNSYADILDAARRCNTAPALSAWNAGNKAGEGYEPNDAPEGTLISLSERDDDVSVYDCGDHLEIVGDSSGPWAVRVENDGPEGEE